VDPHLVTAALSTLRTVEVIDAACAGLTPTIPTVAALRTPPRCVTVTPAVGKSSTMTMTFSSLQTRSVRSHQSKQDNAHVI